MQQGPTAKPLQKLILINDSEENIKSLQLDTDDSDGDNLLNWEENVFGTDKTNPIPMKTV